MAVDSLSMFMRIHNVLTKSASERRPIFYSEAMKQIGWDYMNTYQRNVFAYYLKSIFMLELGAGNPPLAAIVVSKKGKLPQESFFTVARTEGRLKKDETDQQYWKREIVRVYNTWSAPSVAT